MKTRFSEFDQHRFSFHQDPVLILEGFWTSEEVAYFQDAMKQSNWKPLSQLPDASKVFKNCGNWLQSELADQDRLAFLKKISLSCVLQYVESFPDIKQRHVGFNYYSYGAGDCLTVHDDTEGYSNRRNPVQRRLALTTYFHSEWQHNWGGELVLYEAYEDKTGRRSIELTHTIPPKPGCLVIFTVPRLHRVCRVDPLAGANKRLSVSGWFSTEH